MKFGLQHPNYTFDGEGPGIAETLRKLVTRAEDLGFDSFWVMDHFHQIRGVGEAQEPMLEGWTTLAFVAGFTSRIKIGTLVTGIVYRHPSVLAKIGASLDVLSKGRLFMGVGAAWNADEAKAFGIPFPAVTERFRRLEEALQIIREMWTVNRATFNGKYHRIHEAYCNPKPIQKPTPPIMIGGSGERKTLKLVAKYGDACNLFGSPETIRRKLAVLQEHCRAIGRDYSSILKTKLGHVIIDENKEALEKRVAKVFARLPQEMRREMLTFGTPEEVRRQVEAFRDAGVEYFIVNLEPQRELEAMKLFMDSVASEF